MVNKVSSLKWFGLAVQALIVLADHEGLCPSGVVAEQLGTHSNLLRKILPNLVKANLIQAKEGRDGGYLLAKDPAHITLADVYFAMRSEPFSKGFLDISGTDCFASSTQDALCSLKNEMEGWIVDGLEKKTIANLLVDKP
jgi:Rrf2 family transcriptional regulator, repressor of oqxAB